VVVITVAFYGEGTKHMYPKVICILT